jgi:hypothetical protein
VGFLILLLGHGPLFGLATPTMPEGALELDVGAMAHSSQQASALMLGATGVYGITSNLQISVALPIHLHELDDTSAPLARGAAPMPGDSSLEALVGWRFLHWQPAVARRIEATVFAGGGAELAPTRAKLLSAVAAGFVDRRFDIWLGAGYEANGQGAFGSLSLGPRLYGGAVDVRLFGELALHEDAIAAGPSLVVLAGDWTFQAGALFPAAGSEPLRVALTVGRYVF